MEGKIDRGQIKNNRGQAIVEWMILAGLTWLMLQTACHLLLEGMNQWKKSELRLLKL